MRGLVLGVVLGTATATTATIALAQTGRGNQAPATPVGRSHPDIGRFQVVNGTPSMAANIMLLDTATGESWIKCSSEDVGSLWCAVPKSEHATAPRKPLVP
jgi:hypothetical protein